MLHLLKIPKKSSLVLILILFFIFQSTSVKAQKLPDKIRAYKVHKAKVSVETKDSPKDEKSNLRVLIDFDEPKLESVSPFGITLKLDTDITVFGQSGKVDFITFEEFKVNGVSVDIKEYKQGFKFKKAKTVKLKQPLKFFVKTPQTLLGVFKELKNPKKKWRVTGNIFVFGRFKKVFFSFKRVVPVKIDMMIKNPIKNKK